MAVTVYLGGTIFLGGVLIPVLRRRGLDADGFQILGGVIRIFHPVSLGSLGVVILTGAMALTPLKETLGPQFVPRLFWLLSIKLLLVFVLVLVSSYQFFSLGLRFLKNLPAEGGGHVEAVSAQGIQLVRRLQTWNLVAAAIGAFIVYLGLTMSRAA